MKCASQEKSSLVHRNSNEALYLSNVTFCDFLYICVPTTGIQYLSKFCGLVLFSNLIVQN